MVFRVFLKFRAVHVKIALNRQKSPKKVKIMQELVKYRVSFDILLDSNDPSYPDWIFEGIWNSLNTERGEDVQNIDIELVD